MLGTFLDIIAGKKLTFKFVFFNFERSFTPVSTSSRSSGGSGLRSSLGTTTEEPFPKDFMLNDHSIAPIVSNSSINNQSRAGVDMPMEDLAASILSHLAS